MAFDKEKWIDLWNEGTSKVKKTAVDTKDMVVGKYNLSKLNCDLEELYITLGMAVNKASHHQDKSYAEEIEKLNEKIDVKLGEIAAARAELETLSSKKLCRMCGKAVKEENDYCPYCGEKNPAHRSGQQAPEAEAAPMQDEDEGGDEAGMKNNSEENL